MKSKRILTFFGTRPEAIKMIPVIKALRSKGCDVIIGLSGQHIQMVDEILDLFGETADFSLKIQTRIQRVEDAVGLIIPELCAKIREYKPDLVFVHGDTTSTLAGALSAYYERTPVAHIEAGLRSHNLFHPWPEEVNRKLTAPLTTYHFAPTPSAVENLKREGITTEVHMTGNTVIDALYMTRDLLATRDDLRADLEKKYSFLNPTKKLILMTGHRRENLGDGLNNVMQAILKIAERPDVEILFPLHPNPQVRASFQNLLTENCPVHIIEPVPYPEMVWLLNKAKLVITDSGGIQEEAPSFRVPTIVTRETTERYEAVEKGWSKLVGTDVEKILEAVTEYLDSSEVLKSLSTVDNPYGDGSAAQRIAAII